jgi:hypothetical protein
MLRFGAGSSDMRKILKDDIFLLRLKLLIIMCKAYLKNYPMGKYRKKAIIENARSVFELLPPISSEYAERYGDIFNFQTYTESKGEKNLYFDVFQQRVHLLAVMAKALAEGSPMGHFKKKALKDNMDSICEIIAFNSNLGDIKFLKVA